MSEDDDRHKGMKELIATKPDCTFVSFPGLDHLEAWARSNLMLPHVLKFLTVPA